MRSTGSPRIAVVHDFLVDYGGAERVALAIHGAFPGARLHTLLYAPDSTFAAYAGLDVQQLLGARWRLFTRHHRALLPFMPAYLDRTHIEADLVVCSSSGWAHGIQTSGLKVVYCHSPARWLYEREQYFGDDRSLLKKASLKILAPNLLRWDQAAAATAQAYFANSSTIRARIKRVYDRDAPVVAPPVTLQVSDPRQRIDGISPGFLLCVARLLPYKNVSAILEAMRAMPGESLVVAGHGPLEQPLRRLSPPNAKMLGRVTESQLRWLYANCFAVIGAAYEDYGLSPLEGALFGRPALVLRRGGYLDTVVDGMTGEFFDDVTPAAISDAVNRLRARRLDQREILEHASSFSETNFQETLRHQVMALV